MDHHHDHSIMISNDHVYHRYHRDRHPHYQRHHHHIITIIHDPLSDPYDIEVATPAVRRGPPGCINHALDEQQELSQDADR